jgi:hypothetical protein
MSPMERLLRRWKAALQILLLALAAGVSGTVQAAVAECALGEATPAKMMPAEIAQGASSVVDCHDSMSASPQPNSDRGPSGSSSPACDMGTSCASAIAPPVSFDDLVHLAAASAPVALPAPSFRSYNPTPDHPPPRI